jgi:hypothetical protein
MSNHHLELDVYFISHQNDSNNRRIRGNELGILERSFENQRMIVEQHVKL